MGSGQFRHRISIDDKVSVQDDTGDPVVSWVPWAVNIAADIQPVTGSEALAANQIFSKATAKIKIRWRTGITVMMRVRHGSDIYNILGVVPDPKSGRDKTTLLVMKGANEG